MTIPPALINCSYANAAGITAITPNQRQDGDPAFDRGTRITYHFDADSSASAADGVLVPDAGDGRWLSDVAPSADAGGFTTATTHEAQIQEMYQHLFSAVGGYIPIPLSAWREVDATGDVGNITANGGVLASDTTPVFDAVATSNEQEILWATGNADPIGCSVALPPRLRRYGGRVPRSRGLQRDHGRGNDRLRLSVERGRSGQRGERLDLGRCHEERDAAQAHGHDRRGRHPRRRAPCDDPAHASDARDEHDRAARDGHRLQAQAPHGVRAAHA